MAGELKACLFSGETPQTEYWSPCDGRHRDYASGVWIVTIKSSFVRVEKSSLLSMDDAESKAIAAWNTRAQLPSQVVEAVSLDLVENLKYGGMHIRKWENLAGLGAGTHKLYTHPADQAAEPGTVAVPVGFLQQIIAEWEHDSDKYMLARELRAMLGKSHE